MTVVGGCVAWVAQANTLICPHLHCEWIGPLQQSVTLANCQILLRALRALHCRANGFSVALEAGAFSGWLSVTCHCGGGNRKTRIMSLVLTSAFIHGWGCLLTVAMVTLLSMQQ